MSTPAGQGAETPGLHAFPFRHLFVLAVLHLRLRPDDFWRLTPRELLALLAPLLPPAPPDRATLNALLRRYGDSPSTVSRRPRESGDPEHVATRK